MEMTWVLVADSASARFFQWERGELRLVEERSHRPSQDHNQDLMGNRPNENQHSMETTIKGDDPHRLRDDESRVFARELAGALSKAHTLGRFNRLVLVADPRFLGMLRTVLPSPVEKVVIGSMNKRANDRTADEVAEWVQPHLVGVS